MSNLRSEGEPLYGHQYDLVSPGLSPSSLLFLPWLSTEAVIPQFYVLGSSHFDPTTPYVLFQLSSQSM